MKTFYLAASRVTPLLLAFVLSSGAVAQADADTASGASLTAANGERDARNLAHLNISLAVLDPGVPGDTTRRRTDGVFPRIREFEARFLPFVLRETLAQTDEWGAVRVVPKPDPTAELLVYGTIVRSDGVALELQLRAVDSTGREWLNKTYTAVSSGSEMQSDRLDRQDPFQGLYDQIASDLQARRRGLDDKALAQIIEVALLKYARTLSTKTFGGYLQENEEGRTQVFRLPAKDDPLMKRVTRIRAYEYLFTDTLDGQYKVLYKEIAPTYDLWRKYRRELANYVETEEERLQNRKSRGSRGSYESMKRHYDNYRWAKLEEQNLRKWADGFNNEIGPTVMDLDGRVVELTEDLQARYAQWRRILTSIFELETQEGS